MSKIEYFRFEIKPWLFDSRDPRPSEWRIEVEANGRKYGWTQIIPRVPFLESELEMYLRTALEEFRRAGS
jgi:hypothetical protein